MAAAARAPRTVSGSATSSTLNLRVRLLARTSSTSTYVVIPIPEGTRAALAQAAVSHAQMRRCRRGFGAEEERRRRTQQAEAELGSGELAVTSPDAPSIFISKTYGDTNHCKSPAVSNRNSNAGIFFLSTMRRRWRGAGDTRQADTRSAAAGAHGRLKLRGREGGEGCLGGLGSHPS